MSPPTHIIVKNKLLKRLLVAFTAGCRQGGDSTLWGFPLPSPVASCGTVLGSRISDGHISPSLTDQKVGGHTGDCQPVLYYPLPPRRKAACSYRSGTLTCHSQQAYSMAYLAHIMVLLLRKHLATMERTPGMRKYFPSSWGAPDWGAALPTVHIWFHNPLAPY